VACPSVLVTWEEGPWGFSGYEAGGAMSLR
jgi:hypothetical protein